MDDAKFLGMHLWEGMRGNWWLKGMVQERFISGKRRQRCYKFWGGARRMSAIHRNRVYAA